MATALWSGLCDLPLLLVLLSWLPLSRSCVLSMAPDPSQLAARDASPQVRTYTESEGLRLPAETEDQGLPPIKPHRAG